MGTMHSYKSPEGVWYMFLGHVGGASYRIAPDGSYDPKAKAIADDFNNGGHSVTIDGVTFQFKNGELSVTYENSTNESVSKMSQAEMETLRKQGEEDWERIEMAYDMETILGRKLSHKELLEIADDDNLYAMHNYYEDLLNKNKKTSFWKKLFGH